MLDKLKKSIKETNILAILSFLIISFSFIYFTYLVIGNHDLRFFSTNFKLIGLINILTGITALIWIKKKNKKGERFPILGIIIGLLVILFTEEYFFVFLVVSIVLSIMISSLSKNKSEINIKKNKIFFTIKIIIFSIIVFLLYDLYIRAIFPLITGKPPDRGSWFLFLVPSFIFLGTIFYLIKKFLGGNALICTIIITIVVFIYFYIHSNFILYWF